MRMNNPYVTKKTTRPRPWQGAILGICGFFTIVIGSMVPDYVTKKGAIDNGVLFALLLGSVTPILLVIREIWRCYKAKRIGNWFAYYRETSVTFDKLSKEISKSAVKLIDELLKMGYLQNLHIDYEKRFVDSRPASCESKCLYHRYMSMLRRKKYGDPGKSQQMHLL